MEALSKNTFRNDDATCGDDQPTEPVRFQIENRDQVAQASSDALPIAATTKTMSLVDGDSAIMHQRRVGQDTPAGYLFTPVSSSWHIPANDDLSTRSFSRRQSFSTDRESTSLLPSHGAPGLLHSLDCKPTKRTPDYVAIARAETAREQLSIKETEQLDTELKEHLGTKASFRDKVGPKALLRDVIGGKRACKGPAEICSTISDLLDRGASMSDDSGFDAVKCEIKTSGRLEVVELLLARGADISTQEGEFGNALQMACARPNPDIEIVRLLLDWGADVNAPDWFYGSALQLALYSGSAELIKLLLSHGAKHNAADEEFDAAIKKNPYMGTRKDRSELVDIVAGKTPQKRKSTGRKLDFLTGRPTQR